MREVDTTRERMERLQSMGCADYLHMALLDRAERAEAERDQARVWHTKAKAFCEELADTRKRAEKAEAERDAAFAAGQESMRERAAYEVAELAEHNAAERGWKYGERLAERIARAIRALPIKPHP